MNTLSEVDEFAVMRALTPVKSVAEPKVGEALLVLAKFAKDYVVGGLTAILKRLWYLQLPFMRKLTTLERLMIWGAIAYVAWWFGKFDGRKMVQTVLNKTVPGYRWVKYLFGVKPDIVVETRGALNVRKNVLESVRDGSVETPMQTPKSQVLVGQLKEGNFHAHGCGVRFRDFLVLPDHVLSYANVDTKRTFIMGRQRNNQVEITNKDVETIDTDLVYVKLTENEWANVGAQVQTIRHDIPDMGCFASIVGASGQGTTGVLEHDPTVFGRVVYNGTTVGGYSGAPYMVQNQLAGIHQSGGNVNGGYSASYIWIVINQNEKIKEEDTADWMRKMFRTGKKIWIDSAYRDLDEIRIKVDGRYAVVLRDSLAQTYGSDWENDVVGNHLTMKDKPAYADFEAADTPIKGMCSGEEKPSENLGASSGLINSQVEEGDQVLTLTSGFSKLSRSQQMAVIKVLNAIKKATPIRADTSVKN